MGANSRYIRTMRRSIVTTCLALVAVAASSASAYAAPANFLASSEDGGTVFFSTTERLVPGDFDTRLDLYERSYDPAFEDDITREVSTGPIGGSDAYPANFDGAAADGSLIFFSTAERLTTADRDGSRDVYARDLTAGSTELVSGGAATCLPTCGNGVHEAVFSGTTTDGELAFLETEESLDPTADTDGAVDVYARDLADGETTLVSNGDDDAEATFSGRAAGGAYVYFATEESLSGEDLDSVIDIYARNLATGATELVSGGANGDAVPLFQIASADGSRVFFSTDEQLLASDEDSATDVYRRQLPAGPTVLVSTGASGTAAAEFAAASTDGDIAFFATDEQLASGDTDLATDVYRWAGGAPQLVTEGSCSACGVNFNAATGNGDRVLFSTAEALTSSDGDEEADVYASQAPAWEPALVSAGATDCQPDCGNRAARADFSALSSDGSTALMTTTEQLSGADDDLAADVYARRLDGGETTLATAIPDGSCPLLGPCNATYRGVSTDGWHVFFQTAERLPGDDGDSESDVYETFFSTEATETRIVSTGNTAVIGPATPVLSATDPPSPAESTTPRIKGQADPGTSIQIYREAGCVGSMVATGTALELGGNGIQVTVAAGTTTSFFAAATDAAGDTSGCSPSLNYRQAAAADAPSPTVPPPPPPGEQPPPGDGGDGKPKQGKPSPKGERRGDQAKWVAPRVLITFGPGGKTRKRRPVFRFRDATEQPGTEFFCKVDRRRWKRCSSPKKLRRLSPGKHVFKLKSRNAVGTWSERNAKQVFKVVAR
jgi:hypothetical protein